MPYKHLRQSIPTFVCAAVVLTLTAPKHLGMLLVLFTPFIVIALIYNAIAAVRVPENRHRHLTRVVVWLLVPLIAVLFQWYWFAAARSTANAIVAAVTDYKSRTGTWPDSLLEAGIEVSRREFREPYGYQLRNGQPSIAYYATDTIFDTYEYDFESKKWVFYSH